MTLRLIRLVAWGAVVIAAGLLGWLLVRQALEDDLGERVGRLVQPAPAIGGAFRLVDHRGRPFTDADLKGKPAALFFGYTNCPDVCPTTLLEAGTWLASLGDQADKLRIVFVTVDPQRDTPERLRDYLSAFDPRIVGLTGTPEDVAAMLRAYRVFTRKVPLDGGAYAMDHTAAVYLLDAQGRLVSTLRAGEAPDQAARKLKDLVARG